MLLNRLISLLLLGAALPFIIGHGGCLYGPEDSCLIGCIDDECEPECGDAVDELDCDGIYVVSGGPDPDTRLRGSGSTEFITAYRSRDYPGSPVDEDVRDRHTVQYDEEGVAQPFELSYRNHNLLYMHDRPGDDHSSFGEVWAHGDHYSVKLIHSRVAAPSGESGFFNAFFLRDVKTTDLQSNTIASTNAYTLSGDAWGSAPIRTDELDLYVNDEPVEVTGSGHTYPATMFSASRGDRIRVVAGYVDDFGAVFPIWLHYPDGTGVKILERIISGERADAAVDITVLAE